MDVGGGGGGGRAGRGGAEALASLGLCRGRAADALARAALCGPGQRWGGSAAFAGASVNVCGSDGFGRGGSGACVARLALGPGR